MESIADIVQHVQIHEMLFHAVIMLFM